MDEPTSDLHFRLMSINLKIRDLLVPCKSVLEEVGIRPGSHVLDYGCGPGSYVVTTAELVGESGRVHALDIHPAAIQRVQSIASKKRLSNVETICSDCRTGLPDASVDVVLLYDVFHGLGDPGAVLKELHRVLKPGGILSFNDHHMREDDIVRELTDGGLFRLSGKGRRTFTFLRKDQ